MAEFNRLEDVVSRAPPIGDDVLGAVTEMTLFPINGQDCSVLQPICTGSASPTAGRPSSVVIASFSLSPAVFDIHTTPSAIKTLISAIATQLYATIQGDGDHSKCRVLRNLGTSDLVLVCLCESTVEVKNVTDRYVQARDLRLSAIESSAPSNAHIFAAAELFLGFWNPEHGDSVKDDDVLEFNVRIRSDVGHETSVANRFEKSVISTGDYQITVPVTGFHKIQQLLFADLFDPKWREANLIDSSTSVILPRAIGQDEQNGPVWALAEIVSSALNGLDSEIQAIKDLIPPAVYKEAAELRRVIRATFRRHEFVPVMRDLLPFVSHLQLYMKNAGNTLKSATDLSFKELPPKYETLRSRERVFEDLRKTLRHLHRAIRNRIDCRRPQADPQMPATLSRGVSALIPAYNAALNVAAALFAPLPTPGGAGGVPVGSDGLGVAAMACGNELPICVAAGLTNRIRLQQISVSSEKSDDIAMEATRLWLADVSGLQLLRPLSCFTSCLHEAAEVNDWLTYADTTISVAFFSAFNGAISEKLKTMVEQVLTLPNVAGTSGPSSRRQSGDSDAELDSILRFVTPNELRVAARCFKEKRGDVLTLATAFITELLGNLKEMTFEGAPDGTDSVGVDANLRRFKMSECYSALDTLLRSKPQSFSTELRRVAKDVDSHPFCPIFIAVLQSDGFHRMLTEVFVFLTEVGADCAMWLSFDAILGGEVLASMVRCDRILSDRAADLAKLYKSQLEIEQAIYGDLGRHRGDLASMLRRWWFQRLAIECGNLVTALKSQGVCTDSDPKVIEEIRKVRDKVDAMFTESLKVDGQSITEEHKIDFEVGSRYTSYIPLEALLFAVAEYSAYGGHKRSSFCGRNDLGNAVAEVLKDFRELWRDTSRPVGEVDSEFAFTLWAKSQCFSPRPILRRVQEGEY